MKKIFIYVAKPCKLCVYILFSIILGVLLMVRRKVYRRLCLADSCCRPSCVNVVLPTGVNLVNATVLFQFQIL